MAFRWRINVGPMTAFRWRANNGPALNAGLVDLDFLEGPDPLPWIRACIYKWIATLSLLTFSLIQFRIFEHTDASSVFNTCTFVLHKLASKQARK